MVCGCITSRGFGKLVRCEGKADSAQYQKILKERLLLTLEEHGFAKGDVYFQQDNAAIHTSKSTGAWIRRHRLNSHQWRAASPDMNLIEHVWSTEDEQLSPVLCDHQPATLYQYTQMTTYYPLVRTVLFLFHRTMRGSTVQSTQVTVARRHGS